MISAYDAPPDDGVALNGWPKGSFPVFCFVLLFAENLN